jgi:hypothetical protein
MLRDSLIAIATTLYLLIPLVIGRHVSQCNSRIAPNITDSMKQLRPLRDSHLLLAHLHNPQRLYSRPTRSRASCPHPYPTPWQCRRRTFSLAPAYHPPLSHLRSSSRHLIRDSYRPNEQPPLWPRRALAQSLSQ